MKKSILLLLLTCFSLTASAAELVLKKTSLGPLKLTTETRVSLSIIQKLFPNYAISHMIASGDSPDFHRLEAKNKAGDTVFVIKSFLEDSSTQSEEYGIDLLIIYSPEITDEYGIRVGDRLEKALKKRGRKMDFGANHHDNYYGADSIYYNFQVTPYDQHKDIGYTPAELVDAAYARLDNPVITKISWPTASWD